MAYFHSNAVIPIYITPFFTTKVVVQEYAVNFFGERKRLKWAIVGPHSEKDTLQNLMKFFANHEKFRAPRTCDERSFMALVCLGHHKRILTAYFGCSRVFMKWCMYSRDI